MFTTLLNKFARPAKSTAPPGLPHPQDPVCVIGDLHGRADLLDAMFERISDQPGSERARVITVGDMIDRGPESARVLSTLQAAQRAAPQRMICLMGNHERMMLDFLISPDAQTVRWLKLGGAATLRSYGLSLPDMTRPDTDALDALRMDLARAIGPNLLSWLDSRPLYWREGGLAVTHAGADPYHPLERQNPDALLWGHARFGTAPRRDGLWIAHGHWVVAEPFVDRGRVALDTGASKSGRLSAAWFDRNGLKFLTIQG
ncbi:metallophosphoesterase family protein [Thioclava sp. 15-R06ZXC-3]|uniref:Metallophosphoesterase family protein n=1 Tax=Thioclava arctica TaxID=3238301 RepID=A0ABV3THY4_9RHOB